jgi:hypothetical protein
MHTNGTVCTAPTKGAKLEKGDDPLHPPKQKLEQSDGGGDSVLCVHGIVDAGTRTTDGNLVLPFKKGVFHMQSQAKVPLLPVVIRGAYELQPPGGVLVRSGRVYVRPIAAIPYDPDTSHDEARFELQRRFAAEVAKPVGNTGGNRHFPLTTADQLEQLLVVTLSLVWMYGCTWAFLTGRDALGLGTADTLAATAAGSVLFAAAVGIFF